jgi:hypothetical protein
MNLLEDFDRARHTLSDVSDRYGSATEEGFLEDVAVPSTSYDVPQLRIDLSVRQASRCGVWAQMGSLPCTAATRPFPAWNAACAESMRARPPWERSTQPVWMRGSINFTSTVMGEPSSRSSGQPVCGGWLALGAAGH